MRLLTWDGLPHRGAHRGRRAVRGQAQPSQDDGRHDPDVGRSEKVWEHSASTLLPTCPRGTADCFSSRRKLSRIQSGTLWLALSFVPRRRLS